MLPPKIIAPAIITPIGVESSLSFSEPSLAIKALVTTYVGCVTALYDVLSKRANINCHGDVAGLREDWDDWDWETLVVRTKSHILYTVEQPQPSQIHLGRSRSMFIKAVYW